MSHFSFLHFKFHRTRGVILKIVYGLLLAAICYGQVLEVGLFKLEYEVLREGTGTGVQKGDEVKVHYRGFLEDSTLFDESYSRVPLEFYLGAGDVIQGWDVGLVGMKRGEKRKLKIPPELAYGERAMGGIPPWSTLIFEIEMVNYNRGAGYDTFPDLSGKWKELVPGLEYYDERTGTGPTLQPGGQATVHYSGWLGSGTAFGSSRSHNKPAQFVLGAGQVIRGWEQGLAGVQPGTVRYLKMSAVFGYGSQPLARIPANSPLVFRVETLEVEPAKFEVDVFPGQNLAWIRGEEGLRYHIHRHGTGVRTAKNGDQVRLHYTGWFADGRSFDSSRPTQRTLNLELGAGQVIRGWELGLQGMKEGEVRYLWIPPYLGYGSAGFGKIPGNAQLFFLVEMIAVE
jgi:FKBP-type peptidyl-prolyl cis-trans isomerase